MAPNAYYLTKYVATNGNSSNFYMDKTTEFVSNNFLSFFNEQNMAQQSYYGSKGP